MDKIKTDLFPLSIKELRELYQEGRLAIVNLSDLDASKISDFVLHDGFPVPGIILHEQSWRSEMCDGQLSNVPTIFRWSIFSDFSGWATALITADDSAFDSHLNWEEKIREIFVTCNIVKTSDNEKPFNPY